MLPWPEIITTGSSGCWSLTLSSNCRPSSLLPCSQMSRNRRFGRRDEMELSAVSLSRAVRVSKPSSCRMPATSSRISASSSTMRMSDPAMLLARRRKPQPHPCAAAAFGDLRRIGQLDAAAMLLENAADDGETKPGPLLARGDVRLEQPVAVLLRQTGAVVDHVDDDVAVLA